MIQVPVYNLEKEQVDTLELKEEVFAVSQKPHLVHIVVRQQLARKRTGTAKTKQRSEIKGSTKKPYRQKGTGRARRGSWKKSPILRGGGVAFGPQPRDFSIKVPKKVRKEAFRSTISEKLRSGKLFVIDKISLDKPSTKALKSKVRAFTDQGKFLIVLSQKDENIMLSTRNLKEGKYLLAEGLNVYDMLNFDTLLVTKQALLMIQEAYKR